MFLRRTRAWVWARLPFQVQEWLIYVVLPCTFVIIVYGAPCVAAALLWGFPWWQTLIVLVGATAALPFLALGLPLLALIAERERWL